MKGFALLTLLIISLLQVKGQGVRGIITDENDDPLPHASIYVKEKGTGTSSNVQGRYELRLPPGVYKITFQFIGYKPDERLVQVEDRFVSLNIAIKPQSESLQEVQVTGSSEDPAYTIMRKAIAKAPYHLLQLDGYSAEVYMKGTGGLKAIPGLFRKMATENGVDTNRVFTSESISEISFERPNTFKERVISVRTSGEDLSGANPNAYINNSFYQSMVVEAVSPFSPRAMAYYRFRYLGNFQDRGYKIHEIEVTPRSRGDRVFEGKLFIRDDFWNIHSLDLKTRVEIFDLHLVQFFAPISKEVWMPVTQKYEFSGSILGFAGSYNYMASVSNYQIAENEELDETVILVDEKIEEAPEEIEAIDRGNVQEGLDEVFAEDKKVSRKQFKKLMKEYDKQEREESGQEDIMSDYTYKVDSTAATKDSAFWAAKRPVPLTEKEVEGYRKDDSTYVVEGKDSLQMHTGSKFQVSDVFFGGRYKLNKKLWLTTPGLLPRVRFNTVEGFNFDVTGTLYLSTDSAVGYEFTPVFRYGFASEDFYSKLAIARKSGTAEQRKAWALEGGHFIRQFHAKSIDPFVNSLYSLFLEENYMKLYQHDYLNLEYTRSFRYKLRLIASAEWARRQTLTNNSRYSFFDVENVEYQTNDPENIETSASGFPLTTAFKTSLGVSWKPWLKFRKRNGYLIPMENTSPEFTAKLNSGWSGVLDSDVDFQQLELGMATTFDLGVRAKLDLDLEGGSFLRNESSFFMDYKHFDGGLTEFAPLSVTGNYRALPYYLYSTNDSYVSALSHIRFRKLLFTHIPIVRLTGVKESIFVNYLKTTHSPHYSELGYSIDNIFRFLRLEFVQSFVGTEPESFGIRVGVASIFSVN